MTATQLQDLLEARFSDSMAKEVLELVKGMVATLIEGLIVQVTALRAAHHKSDRKIDCLAGGVRAMGERLRAHGTKAQEREERMREQLELLGCCAA